MLFCCDEVLEVNCTANAYLQGDITDHNQYLLQPQL